MSRLTVSEALARYRVGHVERRLAAPRRAVIAIEHLSEHLGLRHVASLRDRDFMRYARTRGVSDSTLRRELGVLRAAIRYCHKQRLLSLADIPHIDMPPESPPRERWLTETQVRVLLDTLEDMHRGERMSRGYRFIVLALATAARRSAIEQLTWDLVDLDTGTIRYDRLPLPSTKKRRVCAPVPDWARPLLERMRSERVGPYILDRPESIRTTFETLMRGVAELTGDNAYLEINRHALRHTYATLALRAGVQLWQVAGLLGDTVETTAATYGHHAQDNLRAAVNSIGMRA